MIPKKVKVRGGLQKLLVEIQNNSEINEHKEYPKIVLASIKGSMRDIDMILNDFESEERKSKVDETVDINGVTALMASASAGHIHCIKMLLHHGADINKADKEGRTALFYTIFHNQQDCFDLLAERGANLLHKDINGMNILHMTANFGRITITDKIVGKYKEISELIAETDCHGYTALHYAVTCKYEDITEKLIVQQSSIDEDYLNKKDNRGMTVLHYVCQQNDGEEWVEYLLEEGSDIQMKDNEGQNILHYCSIQKNYEIAKLILTFGSELDDPKLLLNLIEEKTNEGYTALHYSCLSNNNKVFKILLSTLKKLLSKTKEKFNIANLFDSKKRNLLHMATFMNNSSLIKLIYHYFPPICSMNDNKNRNGLFYCIRNHDILQIIKGKDEQAIDWRKFNEKFTDVEKNKQFDLFQYLIEEIKLDFKQKDEKGRTVLHYSCFYGLEKIVKYLLTISSGNQYIPHLPDNEGKTPLHFACYSGNKECIRLLLLMGANINSLDHHQQSALHISSMHGHFHSIDVLIQLGIEIDRMDAFHKTPLHYACLLSSTDRFKSEKSVQILLQDSMNSIVVRKDENGISPLLITAANGNTNIMKELLHHCVKRLSFGGPDPIQISWPNDFIDSVRLWTPMHYACYFGHLEIIKTLFQFFPVGNYSVPSDFQKISSYLRSTDEKLSVKHPMMEWNDANSMTPLLVACSSPNHFLICKLLVEMGANLLHLDKYNRNCLHIAAGAGSLEICTLLVQSNFNLLYQLDFKKRNALHYARLSKSFELIDYLQNLYSNLPPQPPSSSKPPSSVPIIIPSSVLASKSTPAVTGTPSKKALLPKIDRAVTIRTRTPFPSSNKSARSSAVPISFTKSPASKSCKAKSTAASMEHQPKDDIHLHSKILAMKELGYSKKQISQQLQSSVHSSGSILPPKANPLPSSNKQPPVAPSTPSKVQRNKLNSPIQRAPLKASSSFSTPKANSPPTIQRAPLKASSSFTAPKSPKANSPPTIQRAPLKASSSFTAPKSPKASSPPTIQRAPLKASSSFTAPKSPKANSPTIQRVPLKASNSFSTPKTTTNQAKMKARPGTPTPAATKTAANPVTPKNSNQTSTPSSKVVSVKIDKTKATAIAAPVMNKGTPKKKIITKKPATPTNNENAKFLINTTAAPIDPKLLQKTNTNPNTPNVFDRLNAHALARIEARKEKERNKE